jgi:uncharacterized protein YjbI with pentapeptide repeats
VRFLHEADLIGKTTREESEERRVIIEAIIDLQDVDLMGANLRGANLRNTDLRGARFWTNQQLAQAESLVGATLSDGTDPFHQTMTEEAWEEFKKRYR